MKHTLIPTAQFVKQKQTLGGIVEFVILAMATVLILASIFGLSLASNRSLSSAAYPVEARGNLLYDAGGNRFFAKGVAYNPRNGNYGQVLGKKNPQCIPGTPKFAPLQYYQDPASDDMEDQFKTYLPLIAELGSNVVRLYNIDPEKSHDKQVLSATMKICQTMGTWD